MKWQIRAENILFDSVTVVTADWISAVWACWGLQGYAVKGSVLFFLCVSVFQWEGWVLSWVQACVACVRVHIFCMHLLYIYLLSVCLCGHMQLLCFPDRITLRCHLNCDRHSDRLYIYRSNTDLCWRKLHIIRYCEKHISGMSYRWMSESRTWRLIMDSIICRHSVP